jgi:hypothetical protein
VVQPYAGRGHDPFENDEMMPERGPGDRMPDLVTSASASSSEEETEASAGDDFDLPRLIPSDDSDEDFR